MTKLKLKRTPAEEAERTLKKIRKAARRAEKESRRRRRGSISDSDDHGVESRPLSRSRSASPEGSKKKRKHSHRKKGDDKEYDSRAGPSDGEIDPLLRENVRKEMEERRFRQNLGRPRSGHTWRTV